MLDLQNAINDKQFSSSLLKVFAKISENYFDSLEEVQVATLETKMPSALFSESGVSFDSALEILCDQVIPQLAASRGPRYWGFVTGGATPVATFADWLVTTFDQNLSSGGDSIASNVERQAIKWLCELFELGDEFKGLFTTGATASNFLGALCARQSSGAQQGIDVAKEGVNNLSIEVFSATPHSSMTKTLGLAGLGQNCITKVACLPNSEAIDVDDLKVKMENSAAKSKVIIASAGTVTGTDFDDLKELCKIRNSYDAWLHVDAAFGMFERLLSNNSSLYLSDGIEDADSITLDCHKWLNVPYDCGVFLTRKPKVLFQSCNVPAPYLSSPEDNPDFMALGIENSRRFRALPVWMSLLVYGREGIARWIKSNINLAKEFASEISSTESYELLKSCELNVVLFRPNCIGLSDEQSRNKTKLFLDAINKDGRVFLSPGMWQGVNCIRAAFSNWQTSTQDIDIAMECLREVASKLDNELDD